MKTNCKYIVLAVLLLTVTSILAVTVRFYDSKQLSSTLVTSICQDQRGYIWIGTEYGLNKYDGVRYTQYFNEEGDTASLLNNSVLKVYADNNGVLWVFTKGGVQVYRPNGDDFRKIHIAAGYENAFFKDIKQTEEGDIFLLSSKHGIFRVDMDEMQAMPVAHTAQTLAGCEVEGMCIDKQGRQWVFAERKGVFLFEGNKQGKLVLPSDWNYSERIMGVITDRYNRVYAVTHRKVYRYDEQRKQFTVLFDISVGLGALDLHHNAKGDIIMTVEREGVFLVDVENRTLVALNYGSEAKENWSEQRILAYCEDQAGQVWLGCFQKGVLVFRNADYPFHYQPLSNDETVSCLFADSNGCVYVGKGYEGLQQVNEDKPVGKAILPGKKVLSVCEQNANTWLVGTMDGGAYVVNPNTGNERKIESSAFSRVKSISTDRQGNSYMAVFLKGIRSFDATGTRERKLCRGKMKLMNDYVNVVYTDSHNRVWIGSYFGFEVYDATHDKMLRMPMDTVLRRATIYSINETKDGTIWLGTNRGLFAYHPQNYACERYTTDNGLPNNNICQVIDSKDGSIWVSTFNGLARLHIATGRWQSYYYGNGLQYTNYGRGIGCRTKYGLLCFGNDNGFTYFMPKNIVNKNFLKGITLTGVLLKDKQLSSRDKSGGSYVMDSAVEDAKTLTFSYEDNTFTLQFSTMDYRDLEDVAYQYRFTDEKKEVWHSTQKGISSIMFTHLSWGRHHLQVRAIDNGTTSGVKEITVRILPPWYASWWAYLIYLMIVVMIGFLVWRNKYNKRMAMDNEMKIRLFVDISHEFRSPLTLIKSPLDTMLKKKYDPETMRGLNTIHRNTDRLLTLVNQILSIRRIEKGQMDLHFAEVNMVEFISCILDNFEYDAEKRGIDLKFEHGDEEVMVWLDCNQFDKVVVNLVSNAFKYVEKNGEIVVSLQTIRKQNRPYVLLKVKDSGPGIDEAQINRIFDRFYQTSTSAVGQLGFGIGLNLTRQLVGLHRGRIEVHNRKDTHGAEFAVSLPMDAVGIPEKSMVDEAYFYLPQVQQVESEKKEVLLDQPAAVQTRHKTTYRVVVVDDDEQMLKFLQEELSVVYHVKAFNNGTQALEYIVDNQPDLIVADVKMPGMDGFTLLKRIKGNTKTSHVPVILLTSEVAHQARMTGFEQGADAYVDKPFDMDELKARIAALIANRIRIRGKLTGVQEQKDAIEDIKVKGNNEQLMERIVKVTNERLTDPDFNVEALAADVGISRVQLHRKIKEIMGITTGDFIRNLRIQQAARLLEQGDLNISQITYAVGLTNPTHFSAAFKKYFGVSPRAYMQGHAENKKDEE